MISDIASLKEGLQGTVQNSKWIVEFMTMLALYAGVTTVLAVLCKRVLADGPSIRLVCGIVASFAVSGLLFFPVSDAVDSATVAALLRIRQVLRVPYNLETRNTVFRAVWSAFITTIQTTALWGTGLLGAELVKNVSLPQ